MILVKPMIKTKIASFICSSFKNKVSCFVKVNFKNVPTNFSNNRLFVFKKGFTTLNSTKIKNLIGNWYFENGGT